MAVHILRPASDGPARCKAKAARKSPFFAGVEESMPRFAFGDELPKAAEPGLFARRTRVSVLTGVLPAPG